MDSDDMGRSRRQTDPTGEDHSPSRADGEPYLVVDKKIAVPLYIVVLLFVWLVPATVTVVKFLHRFERIERALHATKKIESDVADITRRLDAAERRHVSRSAEWHREQAKQQWENYKAAHPDQDVPRTEDVGFVNEDGEWQYPDAR